MKILVFSDSHMSASNMRRALELHRGSFDLCLHLGDGVREFKLLGEGYPGIQFLAIAGNFEDCFTSRCMSETVLELEGRRIMLTHGHKYHVKSTQEYLVCAAREKNCDAVLFGHTHKSCCRYINDGNQKPLYLFNPGSISLPRDDVPTYGILDIKKNGILPSVARLQ